MRFRFVAKNSELMLISRRNSRLPRARVAALKTRLYSPFSIELLHIHVLPPARRQCRADSSPDQGECRRENRLAPISGTHKRGFRAVVINRGAKSQPCSGADGGPNQSMSAAVAMFDGNAPNVFARKRLLSRCPGDH